jgi:hypothetical protein
MYKVYLLQVMLLTSVTDKRLLLLEQVVWLRWMLSDI